MHTLHLLSWLLGLGCLPLLTMAQDKSLGEFIWSQLPDLPPAPGQAQQKGLAGAFSGVHQDALILAGGANFPQALPWEGGTKVWWDDIYVLVQQSSGNYRWLTNSSWKLPQPLAYGVSISTSKGLLCIGGDNAERVSDQVFLLRWDASSQTVRIENKPPLPVPLAYMAGAQVGEQLYLAGGLTARNGPATRTFLSLDLSDPKADWQFLSPWPGPARIVPVAAGQRNEAGEYFYLFSGRETAPGQPTRVLYDAYQYDLRAQRWESLPDILVDGQPTAVMAGTATTLEDSIMLIFSGDDGQLFMQLEQLAQQMDVVSDTTQRDALTQQNHQLRNHHPGFSRAILAYYPKTSTWTKVGEVPIGQVTTNAVRWNKTIVIPSGEIQPGTRTPEVWHMKY